MNCDVCGSEIGSMEERFRHIVSWEAPAVVKESKVFCSKECVLEYLDRICDDCGHGLVLQAEADGGGLICPRCDT